MGILPTAPEFQLSEHNVCPYFASSLSAKNRSAENGEKLVPRSNGLTFAAMAKKPTREERERMCLRKRRYKTQADALDAVSVLGLERRRTAYICPLCKHWHLTSR